MKNFFDSAATNPNAQFDPKSKLTPLSATISNQGPKSNTEYDQGMVNDLDLEANFIKAYGFDFLASKNRTVIGNEIRTFCNSMDSSMKDLLKDVSIIALTPKDSSKVSNSKSVPVLFKIKDKYTSDRIKEIFSTKSINCGFHFPKSSMDLVNKIKTVFSSGMGSAETRIMVRPSSNLRHMNVKLKSDRNKPWTLIAYIPVKNVSSRSKLELEDFSITHEFKNSIAQQDNLSN